MIRISSVRRCLRLPANAGGRDFVVGDLHGHRAQLESELARVGFDIRRDRLLSVGDLIDRGPDSLATLQLLEKPWFHAVLGNHELMLLNYLECYASRVHARKSYPSGSGRWIVEASTRQRRTLDRLIERVAELPLALYIEGAIPCQVMHGDLLPLGADPGALFRRPTLCVHEADRATTSRGNLEAAQDQRFVCLHFAERAVRISERPLGTLPLTYVGHSRTRELTVHHSYAYIDQGVSDGRTGTGPAKAPTVIEHAQFALWLQGVAVARGHLPSYDPAARRLPRDAAVSRSVASASRAPAID